jgi:hypothetical protein
MKYCNTLLVSIGATIALSASASALAVTDEEFKALQEQMNQLADAVENQPSSQAKQIHIGGYGELHYNNWEYPDGSKFKELDFHRFVLFFGYDFSDSIRFHSELELEHAIAGEGQNGEIELEQAYIEFDLTENMEAKGGLFLIPVGIINETHEPTTFYGVERNPIEKKHHPHDLVGGRCRIDRPLRRLGHELRPGHHLRSGWRHRYSWRPSESLRGHRQ